MRIKYSVEVIITTFAALTPVKSKTTKNHFAELINWQKWWDGDGKVIPDEEECIKCAVELITT